MHFIACMRWKNVFLYGGVYTILCNKLLAMGKLLCILNNIYQSMQLYRIQYLFEKYMFFSEIFCFVENGFFFKSL